MKKRNGISLIVLIVTVVVVIILASVIILTINKNNPIKSAKEASFKQDVTGFKEELSMTIGSEYANKNVERKNKINASKYIKENEEGYGDDSVYKYIPSFNEKYNYKFIIEDDKLVATTKLSSDEQKYAKDLNLKIIEVNSTNDLVNGMKEDIDKYVGDFVNYNAGIWTEDEMNKVKVGPNNRLVSARNSITETHNNTFQFYGFAVGSDRNKSVKSSSLLKDSDGNFISGWRILDVTNDGIVLISAGCPESYYSYGIKNYGYYGEYILSGNVNENAKNLNLEQSFTKRDWSAYVNNYAKEATVLKRTDLNSWYKKYFNLSDSEDMSDNYEYPKIYGTKKSNLIDNGMSWFLGSCTIDYALNYINNGKILYDFEGAIRVVVKLKNNVSLVGTDETKNITSGGKTYTYKVWNLL